MFFGEQVFKKVGALSGGERSRLKLAMLMYSEVNFLILDEPTNHLDIDSREELEEFLKEFKGTLMFVSHDRYFINNIASRVVELSEGSLTSYGGNYEYYKEKSAEIKNTALVMEATTKDKTVKKQKEKISKTTKGNNNESKKLKLEKQMEELEEQLKNIELEIISFSADYEKLNTLYNEKLEMQNNLDILMEAYFKL